MMTLKPQSTYQKIDKAINGVIGDRIDEANIETFVVNCNVRFVIGTALQDSEHLVDAIDEIEVAVRRFFRGQDEG